MYGANQISLMNEDDLKSELDVHHWMTTPHVLMFNHQSLKEVMEAMKRRNEELIFINEEHHVVGVLQHDRIFELLLQGYRLDQPFDPSWIEVAKTVSTKDTILAIDFKGVVIPVIDQEQKIVGALKPSELLKAQDFLIRSIQHNVNMIDVVLDNAYEGVTVVDQNGFIVKMNKAYRRFIGVTDDVVGRHVTDVIDNTQLHFTAKAGVPERGKVQVISGQKMIVHRIPIWQNNELIGAIGMLIFEGVSELYRILENATASSKRLELNMKPEQELTQVKDQSCVTFNQILGISEEIYACKRLSKKAARTNATVLITGESGTGKEVFAKTIHLASKKANGPFIAINCAAIPEHLLEAELFGYEEGAFTGAKRGGSKGKFERAHNGTIFLDEIGDMPKHMQTKMLRVLEEREVVKVGGNRSIPISVRIIAATNQDLLEQVKNGEFREDLYYRLNVIHLPVPPLRERREDIPVLFSHYLKKFTEEYHMEEKKMDQKVMELIRSYAWPGNIRQLVNLAEQLITLVEGELISVEHLPPLIRDQPVQAKEGHTLRSDRSEYEKEMIERTLLEVSGNKTKAANRLGIHRTTLYKKMKQYRLNV
ncbi:sigma 54-interacting transcriptional regulator [Alkalihalophilus sp. As8PL]|uniref:Sigma 54-interacting transcriptional regulator n=1 Tax=Alkalihalophilus sp. As8PL TaxID=3237103 RepID=A0AB39BWL3_9BACI